MLSFFTEATNCAGLENVNLIIFDECHHGVNDHSMRQIMKQFELVFDAPRVLGLTATLINKNVKPDEVADQVKALETSFHSKIATVEEINYVIGCVIEMFLRNFSHYSNFRMVKKKS